MSSPSRLEGLEERRELSSGIRGEAPAVNAFSTYSTPQNASRCKKNFHFQLSSAAPTTDPTIILSLSSPTGGNCPDYPLAMPLAYLQS